MLCRHRKFAGQKSVFFAYLLCVRVGARANSNEGMAKTTESNANIMRVASTKLMKMGKGECLIECVCVRAGMSVCVVRQRQRRRHVMTCHGICAMVVRLNGAMRESAHLLFIQSTGMFIAFAQCYTARTQDVRAKTGWIVAIMNNYCLAIVSYSRMCCNEHCA